MFIAVSDLLGPEEKSFETLYYRFNFSHPTKGKVKFPTLGRPPRQNPHFLGTGNSQMPGVYPGGEGMLQLRFDQCIMR